MDENRPIVNAGDLTNKTFLAIVKPVLILIPSTMTHTSKSLPDSQVELTITVTPSEYAPFLEKASVRLSERANIKGFRKGKAPFDVIKKEVGEMAIMQEALEDVVKSSFFDAVKTDTLETIGMPQISIEKLAPENDIVYKAVVALMPTVTLGDVSKIKIKKEDVSIDEKKMTETLDAVRGMHATEVIKDAPATGTDKLVIDMDMLIDDVPVDGGQAKNYQVYLSEDHYIPGFNQEVEGLKKGDTKSFSLSFPETHYQKHLAGKKVDFKVTVKDVFERQLPELSDDLAKTLGQDSMEELKKLIHNNILEEAKHKAEQKAEIEILDTLIEKTKFAPIPEVLINAERQKMFYELKRDLERNGVEISQYLADIKKTEEEIFNDFKVQAEKRAKAALVSRQVAVEQNIVISDEELDAEIEKLKEMYKTQKEHLDNLKKLEVRDTIATSMQNRKVMEWLKTQVFGEEKKK
jgi:trigger factor